MREREEGERERGGRERKSWREREGGRDNRLP